MFVCCKRNEVDPDNPQHDQYVSGLVNALINELEMKANTLTSEDMFLTKLKLIETASNFRVSFVIYTSFLSKKKFFNKYFVLLVK